MMNGSAIWMKKGTDDIFIVATDSAHYIMLVNVNIPSLQFLEMVLSSEVDVS